MKLDTAGPIASQLNMRLRSVEPCAARPTCRCNAMEAAPVDPPVTSAATHITANTGAATASEAASTDAITASPTGRRSPWRSAYRPDGIARNTGASANSAIRAPTDSAL
jgi:hypothetical protein